MLKTDDSKMHKEFEYYCLKNCVYHLLKKQNIFEPICYIDSIPRFRTMIQGEGFILKSDYDDNILIKPFSNFITTYSDIDMNDKSLQAYEDEIFESDKQIIIAVDIFYLPYTEYYRKKHSYHTLIMKSINKAEGWAEILDWYSPWYYDGKINLSTLMEARNSKNEGVGLLNNEPIAKTGWILNEIDSDFRTINFMYHIIKNSVFDFYKIGYKEIDLFFKKEFVEKKDNICIYQPNGNLHSSLFFMKTRFNLFKLSIEEINTICYNTLTEAVNVLESIIRLIDSIIIIIFKYGIKPNRKLSNLIQKEIGNLIYRIRKLFSLLYVKLNDLNILEIEVN